MRVGKLNRGKRGNENKKRTEEERGERSGDGGEEANLAS